MIEKVGIQTFTIRNDIKNPENFENALRFYAQKGIKNFELSRINFYKEELQVLLKLKEELGLNYTASQITMRKINQNFDFLMEFSNTLGIKFIEVSVIPFINFLWGKDGILDLAQKLNDMGRRTKEHGVGLLYHHHNYELIKYGDRLSFDILVDKTDPELVSFVCDTYWLARSGYSPAKFIEDRIKRVKGIHLRDSTLKYRRGMFVNTDEKLGSGTIDFESVIELDKYNSIDFYSIEQDTDQPQKHIIESYNYLKSINE